MRVSADVPMAYWRALCRCQRSSDVLVTSHVRVFVGSLADDVLVELDRSAVRFSSSLVSSGCLQVLCLHMFPLDLEVRLIHRLLIGLTQVLDWTRFIMVHKIGTTLIHQRQLHGLCDVFS